MAFSKAIALTVILVVISLFSLGVVGFPRDPIEMDCVGLDGDCTEVDCCSKFDCNPANKKCVPVDDATESPEKNCIPRGGHGCFYGSPDSDCCGDSVCYLDDLCI